MYRWITIGSLGFCLCKFSEFALINLLSDSFAKARAQVAIQSLDFFWFGIILIACRARKEWPPYFTLSINELPGQEEGANGPRANLPGSVTSFITSKFLFDDDNNEDDRKSVGSIGSDEAVMFVNPCNYTLEVDDFEEGDGRAAPSAAGHERSAFEDPDIIEEESNLINAGGQNGKAERAELF